VKSSGAKSRLAGVLTPAQREEFSRLLLVEVIQVTKRAGLLRHCRVVTSDEGTLDLAARLGATTIREPGDTGVNDAVLRGMEGAGDPESILVMPSDLPLLEASDVKHVLTLGRAGVEFVLAPSLAFDGTNALLMPRGRPLALSYDTDSFWNHLSAAARGGLPVAVCTRVGLTLDIDTPEDLAALARSKSTRPSARFVRRVFR
jgi:2-phospho-L-lactate/phosphoenolpyruvate guanylyltransferase